ncbi:hypothetical protein [Streptacidiphilus sp. EB103A]|uniref:hypothetical protein n=1 Tax=Streptacidiphilus sp. EB103A TaxID=3156275 RepID=UPI0035172BA2
MTTENTPASAGPHATDPVRTGVDLSTEAAVRAFLDICLHGRIKRTPAKLASTMAHWLRDPLHEHAPHLVPLHERAQRLRREAEAAQRAHAAAQHAYTAALTRWITTPNTTTDEAEPGGPHRPDHREPR